MSSIVLGIDVAWTEAEPSGITVVANQGAGWRCVAVAPSYASFIGLARGAAVDWDQALFPGCLPNIPEILDAAQMLAEAPVDLVTVDMPIATVPITGRRVADNAISSEFGRRGCSTHSPTPKRPGALGAAMSTGFREAGFPIATLAVPLAQSHHLLEVYPHPALLALLPRNYRVPYKIGKASRYWPSMPPHSRISLLLDQLSAIGKALVEIFGPIEILLPSADDVRSFRSLKRYEDALDALVCAWVGVCYLEGKAVAFGDDASAIWCPKSTVTNDGKRPEGDSAVRDA